MSLLATNAADDERNPPETGLTEAAMKRVTTGKLLVVAAGADSRGHATTGNPKLYQTQLQEFLQALPRRAM